MYTSNVLFAQKGRIVNIEALKFIRNLARESKSAALGDLASNMSVATIDGFDNGGDPFSELKSLLDNYISSLEAEDAEESKQKAACKKEASEADADLTDLLFRFTLHFGEEKGAPDSVIDRIKEYSAISEKAAELNGKLLALSRNQAAADHMRSQEKEVFGKNREALQTGLAGVQKAQWLMTDLHQDENHADFGIRIWELLAMCHRDFRKGLTKLKEDEDNAIASHEVYLKKTKIDSASTEFDARHANEQVASLYETIVSATPKARAELDAISAHHKLKVDCENRADTHLQQARRKTELDGLKKALQMLQEDEGLVHTVARRRLRGFLGR
jgi:hypothetical protein